MSTGEHWMDLRRETILFYFVAGIFDWSLKVWEMNGRKLWKFENLREIKNVRKLDFVLEKMDGPKCGEMAPFVGGGNDGKLTNMERNLWENYLVDEYLGKF
jgi:hypothetical protein